MITFLRWLSVFAIATLFGTAVGARADVGRNVYRQDAAGRRACVHCHGYDGRGSSEGRPVPPDITWRVLTSERGYRDASSLARAVSKGQAPDGRRLAMPAMALDEGEVRELIDYLGRIEGEDRRGAEDGFVTLAVGLSGEADPFPALLTQALNRHGAERSVFGWRFRLEPSTVEKLARLEQGTAFFAAVGVTEPIADAAARAFARQDIPNLMPRGFFVGFEARETAFGLFPTLSRIADAAETAGCRATEMALQTDVLTNAERVERFLRIPVIAAGVSASAARRPNCVLRVVAVPVTGAVNVLLLQPGSHDGNASKALVFEPLMTWREQAGDGLDALADMTARSLLDALVAMRGNPGRTSFVKAFRQSFEERGKARGGGSGAPIALTSTGIAAMKDVSFVPLR